MPLFVIVVALRCVIGKTGVCTNFPTSKFGISPGSLFVSLSLSPPPFVCFFLCLYLCSSLSFSLLLSTSFSYVYCSTVRHSCRFSFWIAGHHTYLCLNHCATLCYDLSVCPKISQLNCKLTTFSSSRFIPSVSVRRTGYTRVMGLVRLVVAAHTVHTVGATLHLLSGWARLYNH